MRQICLDTETTGTEADKGDRIVEIGCFEIVGRTLSDDESHVYWQYVNPERDVPAEAVAIHGITNEFLADKPVFADIADDFLKFVKGAELIIHNASFDVGFLNMELARLGKGKLEDYCPSIVDSLAMARKMYPGLRNSLDALCTRYEVDSSMRTLHGACLDARLLGEVYLAMTRKQEDLMEELERLAGQNIHIPDNSLLMAATCPPEDMEVHKAFMERNFKKCPSVWSRVLGDFENLDPAKAPPPPPPEPSESSAS